MEPISHSHCEKEMMHLKQSPQSQTYKCAINIDYYCHLYNSKILFVGTVLFFKIMLCSSNDEVKKHPKEWYFFSFLFSQSIFNIFKWSVRFCIDSLQKAIELVFLAQGLKKVIMIIFISA